MANIKEFALREIIIHPRFLSDALAAVLHTILYVRAPHIQNSKDQNCEELAPLIFTKCGPVDVDETISAAIEIFRNSLVRTSKGILRGEILLSFYEKREVKEWGGFVTRLETAYFERWRISISLAEGHMSGDNMDAAMAALYRTAYDQVSKAMIYVMEAANSASDHVPLTIYDYEVQVLDAPAMAGSGFATNNNGINNGGGVNGVQVP